MSRSFSGWEPKKLWLTPADGGRSTECAFTEGFDSRADGRSLLSVDLDGDGDQDLVMRNRAQPKLQLFENEGPVGNSVEVQLISASGSPEGEGAQVYEGGRVFPVVLGRGYASGVEPVVHIGLGSRKQAAVDVRWRSGNRSHFTLEAGQRVRLFEDGHFERVWSYRPKRRAASKPFPSRLVDLGVQAETDVVLIQLFSKGCKACVEEVPVLKTLSGRVQLMSFGLHEGEELEEVARSLGISWSVSAMPEHLAEALSTSGSLPLPLVLLYKEGVLHRVLPGARGLQGEKGLEQVLRSPGP